MKPTRPTVFLFDIDGTLISTGGAARRALEVALAELLDRPDFRADFSFGGMTDRAIMRRSLSSVGVTPDDASIEAAIAHYLTLLDRELERAPQFIVHPGVLETLEALRPLDRCAIGLGTGNVERGARIKLARVDLNRHFDFGGFGCDAELRPELIRAGAERGAARLGTELQHCRVVVIGDTTRDIDAAHANGFECIAVCTGGDARETLAAARPEWLVETLADPITLAALAGA